MRKTTSILLVGLMIVGMVGCVQAVAEERNELEELVGLEIKIIYFGDKGTFGQLYCQGRLLSIRGNWLIMIDKKDIYTWCYIPNIMKIQILDREYKPEERSK